MSGPPASSSSSSSTPTNAGASSNPPSGAGTPASTASPRPTPSAIPTPSATAPSSSTTPPSTNADAYTAARSPSSLSTFIHAQAAPRRNPITFQGNSSGTASASGSTSTIPYSAPGGSTSASQMPANAPSSSRTAASLQPTALAALSTPAPSSSNIPTLFSFYSASQGLSSTNNAGPSTPQLRPPAAAATAPPSSAQGANASTAPGYAHYWRAPGPATTSTLVNSTPASASSLTPRNLSASSSAAAAAAASSRGAGAGAALAAGIPAVSRTTAQAAIRDAVTRNPRGPIRSTADRAGWSGTKTGSGLQHGFEENNVVSFTWNIHELHLLKDEIESANSAEGGRSASAGAGKSEIWTTQPVFGHGKWRAELLRGFASAREMSDQASENGDAQRPLESPRTETAPSLDAAETKRSYDLGLFLTSTQIDYLPAGHEIPASVFVGLRPCSTASSVKLAPRAPPFFWTTSKEYVFRKEREFLYCGRLPNLAKVLRENATVREQDAFALTIQIATGPAGTGLFEAEKKNEIVSMPFEVPGMLQVPQSMLAGLAGLVDCSTTGDVVLVVRERGLRAPGAADGTAIPFPLGASRPADTSDWSVVVRDRLLWAHSSILSARSEYLRTMLDSGFTEGQQVAYVKGRTVKALRIADSDFSTVYALLKFLYLEECTFMDEEDIRSAALDDTWMLAQLGEARIEGSDGGSSVVGPSFEWRDLEDVEAALVVGERHDQGIQASALVPAHLAAYWDASDPRSAGPSRSSPSDHSARHSYSEGSAERVTKSSFVPWDDDDVVRPPRSPTPSSPAGQDGVKASIGQGQEEGDSHLGTPRALTTMGELLLADPIPHPIQPAGPCSALALYKLAHRLSQLSLASLCKSNLLANLTPRSAFPLLLATHLYKELHEGVKAYVLAHWSVVSRTEEFEKACAEVSRGEWGGEAGNAISVIMRCLVSPSSSNNPSNGVGSAAGASQRGWA